MVGGRGVLPGLSLALPLLPTAGHLLPRGLNADIDWREVTGLLQRRLGLLDAVVFSGGEPMVQRETCRRQSARFGRLDSRSVCTAGCYPERLDELLPAIDWVGLDIRRCRRTTRR